MKKRIKKIKKRTKFSLKKTICLSLVFLSIVLSTLFVFKSYMQLAMVSGDSMAPTIHSGSIILTNRLGYKNDLKGEITRGDIITLNHNGSVLVKRVVGLEGDKISFKDGLIYINNNVLNETYLGSDVYTYCNETFEVPKGHFFVLGDNRKESNDSRTFFDPYVRYDYVYGRVIFSFDTKTGFPFCIGYESSEVEIK